MRSTNDDVDRKLLWTVLAINAGFFVAEGSVGLIAGSMGLIADSLDMLADAIVYGLSLFAIGGPAARKRGVARWAGAFQLTLALLGLIEVVRRFVGADVAPDAGAMMGMASLALVANAVSLWLLQRARSREAHIRASQIFTSNDIVINFGVITAGVLVAWSGSALPDLVVGAIVFGIVSRGAVRILRLSA